MTLPEHLRQLFSYDRWANTEILNTLQQAAAPPPKSVRLFAHIIAAQMLWMDRIGRSAARAPVWPGWTLQECADFWARSQREWEGLAAGMREQGLAVEIGYTNTKGEKWISTQKDILVHVANHGTYHRAQIALELRNAGITPPYTDYIEGVRRGKVCSNIS